MFVAYLWKGPAVLKGEERGPLGRFASIDRYRVLTGEALLEQPMRAYAFNRRPLAVDADASCGIDHRDPHGGGDALGDREL